MEFTFTKDPIEEQKTDIILFKCQQIKDAKESEKGKARLLKSDGGIALDKKLDHLLTRIIEKEEFEAEEGKSKLIHTFGKLPAGAILLVGIGKPKDFTLDTARKVGAVAAEHALKIKASSLCAVLQPEKVQGLLPHERLKAFAEGLTLGMYEFNAYKSKKTKDKKTLKEIRIVCARPSAEIKKAIQSGVLLAEAQNWVRDLVNTPSDDMTPEIFAKIAAKSAKEEGLKCITLSPSEMKRERMNLTLSVARGSKNPPTFTHITYKPKKRPRLKVALVGKGITFDSGGYNLKSSKYIDHMKDDMAGAAVALAVMRTIARLKPPIQVDAYIPAAENMVGSGAQKPGDIVTARNGKTIELVNMDAEGRLILADALDYASQEKPNLIIDVATLTGGVLYALGETYSAVLGNDQREVDRLIKASKISGEPHWQLPLVKEYKEGFKSGPADLRNIGKTGASTISAALFLEEFVGETKWLHIDIAESAWAEENHPYTPKGGTGVGLRTLVEFLTSL